MPTAALFTSPMGWKETFWKNTHIVSLPTTLLEMADDMHKNCLIRRGPRNDVSVTFFFEAFWVIKEQMHVLGMLFLSEEGASHPKHCYGERSSHCINYTEILKK